MIGCWQSAGYMERSSCTGSTDKDWRSAAQKRKHPLGYFLFKQTEERSDTWDLKARKF